MQQKGQGLPLNTIILAILVVIVLIVVVAFFIGGSSSLTDAIKRVFFGTTAGYDINLAYQTCENRCDIAKNTPEEARGASAYCQTALVVDKNSDGEADYITATKDGKDKKITIKYYCPPKSLYNDGSFIDEKIYQSLNVNCDLGTTGTTTPQPITCAKPPVVPASSFGDVKS